MTFTLNRKKFVVVLSLAAFLLVLIHSIVLGIYFAIDDPDVFDFVRLVDLDYEGNLPTIFSTLLFLFNGLLFYVVYSLSRDFLSGDKANNKNYSGYWLGLAFVFVFLGFDEGGRLHEEVGDLVENFVTAEGLLYFPWVIPYSILFLLATALYFRFYLTLERSLRIRLFLCALIFLSGAIGFEMLSAREADISDTSSLRYCVLYTIEETLEMAGLILLIDTLIGHISRHKQNITLNII